MLSGAAASRAVAPAIFIALVSGVLVGAAIIARMGAREGRKATVPFGPFLAFGALVDAYLSTF